MPAVDVHANAQLGITPGSRERAATASGRLRATRTRATTSRRPRAASGRPRGNKDVRVAAGGERAGDEGAGGDDECATRGTWRAGGEDEWPTAPEDAWRAGGDPGLTRWRRKPSAGSFGEEVCERAGSRGAGRNAHRQGGVERGPAQAVLDL